MKSRAFALVMIVVMLAVAAGPVAAEPAYPAGVPDLTDPRVRDEYVLLAMGRFGDDPDFPVMVLGHLTGEAPHMVLVVVDARNGKDTWSLQEDAPVFFILFADPNTVEQAYMDQGFAEAGAASGQFVTAGPDGVDEFWARLRASHRFSVQGVKLSI